MRILVTGAGGPAGKALTPQLIAHGVTVIQVDMVAGETIRQVPPALHPTFLTEINRIVHEERIDAIIPTVQEELPVFANANLPVPVLVSNPHSIAIADDKWLTYHHLNRAGIPVPRSTTPGSVDMAAVEWMGEKVISKPRRSRGGRGINLLHLPTSWELANLPEDYLLSEFASGTEYAPNVFISPWRTECVVLKKTQLAHGMHGNALSVVAVDEPDIAELAISAAQSLGLFGPVDVDIRRRADGTPVVLEVNARFGANSAHAPVVVEAALEALGRARPHLFASGEVMM